MPIDHKTATCRLGVGNRTHYYAEKRRQNELLTYMNQHIFHDIMIATKATRTAPQNVITIVTAFYTGNAPPPPFPSQKYNDALLVHWAGDEITVYSLYGQC